MDDDEDDDDDDQQSECPLCLSWMSLSGKQTNKIQKKNRKKKSTEPNDERWIPSQCGLLSQRIVSHRINIMIIFLCSDWWWIKNGVFTLGALRTHRWMMIDHRFVWVTHCRLCRTSTVGPIGRQSIYWCWRILLLIIYWYIMFVGDDHLLCCGFVRVEHCRDRGHRFWWSSGVFFFI